MLTIVFSISIPVPAMNLRFPSSSQTRIFLELSNSESMVEMLPIPEYLYIFLAKVSFWKPYLHTIADLLLNGIEIHFLDF